MKKIVLLLVGVLVSCLGFGQTTIWSSDFSNTADWEITTNAATGSLNWVITNTKPTTFNKAESNWINSFTAFNSKSFGNYAVVDGTNTGNGTRTAIISTKNSFSTTGKEKVKVSFSQFYTKWQDVTSLEVSTDKTNWTPFVCNSTVAKGGSTQNGNVYSIDISSAAANKSQVWIRFVYAGKVGNYDYAWFIDDVSIEEIVANELSALSAFFYSKSSACGLTNDKVGFAVINNGTAVVPNGTSVAYKVNNGTEVVESVNWLSTKLQAKSSFAQGDTAIYFFTTPVDLTATQTYIVKIYSKLNGDGNVSNDTAKTTIINYSPTVVTNQNSFNEDFENSIDKTGGFTAETIDQNGIKFGIASVGNTLVNSSSGANCFRIFENNISRVSEDWLYSRCLNLSPDYTYTLTFYNRVGALSSGKNAGKIQTSIGTSPISSAMTTIIGAEKSLKPDGNYYVNTNTFSVNSEGVYYVGFRARNTSADSTINLRIDDVSITAKGNKAELLSFGVNAPSLVQGTINSVNNTITVTVPNGTSLTALVTMFTVSPGATFKLNNNSFTSGSTFNYTSNVACVVTSEDGKTTKTYTVQVTETPGAKSSAKDFLTFSINGKSGVIGANTISVVLPAGTSLTNLTPMYTTSDKATVTSGANTTNFASPVVYTITAEDGTTKNYTVTVTTEQVSLSNLCELTSFTLGVVAGTINSNNIVAVTLPNGSSLTQVASFVVSSGATVKIGSTTQISGVTSNSYSADVVYEVTAQDGVTKKIYTVKVTVVSAPVLGCKDLDNWKDGKDTVPALYPIDSTGFSGSGYFTGTGNYYFQGLHEKFENLKDGKYHKLNSVKYVFGNLVSGYDTNTVLFVGYLPDATTKLPGTTFLFSKRILVKTVASSLNSNGEFILDLSNDNIKVKGAFYAGLTIKYRQAWGTPDIFQDTIALLSNTMGVTGSTINSAYCNYRNSNKVMVYDTIMPDNARFSLGVFANVCDLSSANDLLTYNIVSPVGVVSTSGNSISIKLPLGTNPSLLTSLIANFTTSPKSTISIGQIAQVSGQTSNDFSKSIIYTITAEDGSTKDYTVVVTIEQSVKSSEKDFLTYSINGVQGSISTANNTITLTLPAGTDLTNLTAVYTTSAKSSVTSGAATVNFTNPVTYTITAEDGTTKVYTVKVTSSSTNQNTGADLLTFGFTNPNVIGVISGTNIAVSVPYGTNIKSLVASFTASTGAVVKVSNILQVNVGSVVDYTAPVTFVVTSEDGKTIKNYVVTVTITPLLSSANEMLTFGFASPTAVGTISGNTIGLTVPFGTIVTALKANFTSSPNSIVRVGPTIQVSGSTPNNFTTAQLYTVVAQDGSVKDYTVVVTISSQIGGSGSSAKDILSFGLLNPFIDGTIAGNTITITGQAGSDISKQQISFGVSPGATLTLNGVVLTTNVSIVNFSNPVTLVVVAVDGSKKEYIVTVTIPKKNGKQITFFKLLEVPSATSTIDEANKVITVHVPYGTSLSLTSVFGLSPGAKVTVGGIIQASGASQISYASNVNYVVTAEDGSTATYTVKVIIDPNTAGLEMLDNSVVRIFPNPSNGAFTCASSIETYEIIVTDILGHSVYTSRVEPNGTGTHTFDVSSFGAGVYFATIQFEGTAKMFKLEVIQ